MSGQTAHDGPHIEARGLTVSYDALVVMHDVNFAIARGDVFVIMGPSGCGKSTLLKALMGLKRPSAGQVLYGPVSFWDVAPGERDTLMRRSGILYQGGALWSAMTLAENVALPLEQNTALGPADIQDMVAYKLSLVGLAGFADAYPSEISGGMRKRAGLARALALDPEILFFDEPSAGLDPVNAKQLDDLIIELSQSLGTTVVIVTHELASIFAIGTDAIYLDAETKTLTAQGKPMDMLKNSTDPKVLRFLTRDGTENIRQP